MFGMGMGELLVIGVIAFLIFGPKKLPDLGKALGKGLAEFRRATQEIKEQVNVGMREDASGEMKDFPGSYPGKVMDMQRECVPIKVFPDNSVKVLKKVETAKTGENLFIY